MRPLVSLFLLLGCGGGSASPDGAAPAADAGPPDGGCEGAAPRESTVDVGGVTLHVVTRGCGPRMVLLPGFPEFSFSWDPIAGDLALDHEVVAVDQRGYAPSTIPPNVEDYAVSLLVGDIVALVAALGPEPVILVAHDWGGIIAWVIASQHPELLRGLVIVNAPHPDVFKRELETNPDQQMASQYMNFFMADGSEAFLAANDYQALIDGFDGLLTPEEEARYRAAWAQPGTLVGGLNWYRANLIMGPEIPPSFPTNLTVNVPTLVVWGTMDRFILASNLVGLDAYVTDLTIQELPDSGHWVMYSEPAALVQAIRGWVGGL